MREEKIDEQGRVKAPVTRVVEDEDGGDTERGLGGGGESRRGMNGEREWPGVRGVVSGEGAREGPEFRVGIVDIRRGDDVGEAVAVCK